MAKAAFQNLRVYRLAEQLADVTWEISRHWGLFARDTVGKQLVRAADSVGANIAEGFGRGSRVENRRFVRIARGSLNEVIHFLRRAYRRGLVTEDQTQTVQSITAELGPRLNAYLNSIGIQRIPSHRPTNTQTTTNNQQSTINNQQSTINNQPLTTDH